LIKSRLYGAEQGNPYLFATTFDKITILPNLLRLFVSGKNIMEQLDHISLAETITKYNKGKIKLILELNPRLITTVNNLHLISTGEVFRTQRQMKLKGVRYPEKGIEYLCSSLAERITSYGGTIHLDTPVTKILIANKKATGVVANGTTYPCDTVISTMLVQDLFTIAEKQQFPKDYVDALTSLQGTGSLCAYYAFSHVDPKIRGKNFVFIERDAGVDGTDAAGMVDFMSAVPESSLAPPQQYLVQSYVICTPEEAKNKETLEKLKRILDRQLENIFPDYRSYLLWAIYPSIWHLDGVAKTIDNMKPEIQTPIQNLYLVGDCVKAPGIGVNCAINSARILSQMLSSSP